MRSVSLSLRCAAALLTFFASTAAQSEASATAPQLTRPDLEAWLDGYVPYTIAQSDVAGAVVVVVKDGQVLLQKGYGYRDVSRQLAVDPERTLFRPGSISKIFTWTAVMQLVGQGKIDLDRDIGEYLDFGIPARFGKPITMRHLLTHTPGFEEPGKGTFFEYPQTLPSLEAYVKGWLPRRIFPPGEIPAYSNYGTALAGYIVQRVSAEPFDEYIERHILRPLGMARSTFRQPLPQAWEPDMAQGYELASGPTLYQKLIGPAPAGSLTATGADMGRFMIAHLQAQSTGGGLMQPQTAQLMYRTVRQVLPPLDGIALGFLHSTRNGQRIIWHGGDLPGFHSDMNLFLDQGVGLYISYNSDGKGDASLNIRMALLKQFMDRYFPQPLPDEATAPTALAHARELAAAGPYEASRRSDSNFFALAGLLGQLDIEVGADATISLPEFAGFDGQPKRWREVGEYLWREVGGRQRLSARIENGTVQFLSLEPFASILVLQPVPAWRLAAWNLPLLLGTLAVLLIAVLSWPACWLLRRKRAKTSAVAPAHPISRVEARAFRWTRVVALVDLVFLLGWIPIITASDATAAVHDGRMDPWIMLLQAIGVLGVAGTAIALYDGWLVWRGAGGAWRKVASLLLAVACLAVVWFAFAFNLITFSVAY